MKAKVSTKLEASPFSNGMSKMIGKTWYIDKARDIWKAETSVGLWYRKKVSIIETASMEIVRISVDLLCRKDLAIITIMMHSRN
jgi:hypothetical protein